jgi:TonB family protein
MSAWKALYVIPLVGISLAATAETRVDYQYEDQTPDNTELVEKYSTPVDKDTKKSFKEKNLKNGRITVDEENDVVTMIYYGLDGKERQSQITGLPLGKESYFINGSFATKGAADIALEKDPDAVLLSAYLKNGNKVRAIISADYGKFVTGTVDCSKPINTLVIKEGEEQPQLATVATPDLVYVINGERMPEGFDLNTIDPATITSMEVLKTEKALQEYGTDKGVIVITTGEPKKNDDGKQYMARGGKYVEMEAPKIKVRDANGNDVEVSESNLVYVINGEIMPEGFDLNTIDPKTIASMEVLKTQKALQEYGTDKGVIVITTGQPKKNEGKKAVPFQQVAQKPGFNGGDANEFSKYVAQNVVYPESCRQSKIEGRVTLEFTITETGKVADIKILRSVNSDLDREAVRVVAQSPIWTPGRDENGKVVPVKYTFPVIFKLPDSENK